MINTYHNLTGATGAKSRFLPAIAVEVAMTGGAALAWSAVTRAAAPAATVTMTDSLEFKPNHVTIHVGDTIRWKSNSRLVHTVTANPKIANDASDVHLPDDAKSFNSGDIAPGANFTHTFKVAGKYRYFCIPHESAGMVANVTVKP